MVYCEFNRVVGENLKDNFFDALDRFSPSLIDLFRKKKGVTGQFLSELLSQTKTTEPTDIGCLCVRGLPIILGDEPSAFFKTCTRLNGERQDGSTSCQRSGSSQR
ncbi:hypothetical protein KUCAC02_020443 [Chaenocephalus aceratus]|nr:hypothetical protein KUCAC02_020443 [Chaenocephalus aceratus]